jgi:hypothetical protein
MTVGKYKRKTLHPTKTEIVGLWDGKEGFDFLGWVPMNYSKLPALFLFQNPMQSGNAIWGQVVRQAKGISYSGWEPR